MKTLKLQIKKRLTDDATYIALMGSPTEEPFQTYWFKPPVQPTFPETVLTMGTIINDESNGRDLMSFRCPVSINVWSKDEAYEDIIDRIIQLLHQNPETTTTGFRAILNNEPQDMYDDEFNVYGKVVQFDVVYRRSTI